VVVAVLREWRGMREEMWEERIERAWAPTPFAQST
jgi:hypothetical protein